MRRLLRLLLPTAMVIAAMHTAVPALAADVEIRVSTVKNAKGMVRAEVCRAVEWLKAGCALEGAAPARQGVTVVIVHGVPPGVYAIVAWHDKNNNDKVDQNWLGIPEEGVGFSNDPSLGLHGPRFSDSAVTIEPEGIALDIHINFE